MNNKYLKYYAFTLIIIYIAIAVNGKTFHWFLLPLFLINIVLAKPIVAWFSAKDIFGLKHICALFNYYYFFISPLFYIAFEGKLPSVPDNLPDWRDTIGYLSIVNFIGLLIFTFIADRIANRKVERIVVWTQNSNTKRKLIAAILFTGLFAVLTIVKYGGLAGLFNAFSGAEDVDLTNASLYTILSYPFPILIFFYILLYRKHILENKFYTLLIFLFILIVQVIISGASGARGTFVYVLFWAFIVYHYFIKTVSRKAIFITMIPLVLLLWVFSFYKTLKLKAVDRIMSGESLTSIADDSNRGLESLFWGDMSRISIHAYMFNKLQANSGYDLRWGSTYVESIYPVIPFWIWRDKPLSAGKIVAGTELLYGKGYYAPGTVFFTSNAYGITGEAALNFGMVGFIIGFIIWGILVGLMRNYSKTLNFYSPDYRIFIYPFFIWWSFNLLLWDSDNYFGHNLTKSFLLLLIINWMFAKKKFIIKST